jgi:RNA polymerase sigma-70 factor (ECF subfamily)
MGETFPYFPCLITERLSRVNTDLDESHLIERAQAGDAVAFGGLVLLHQDFVYDLALSVLRDPAEAEDLAQEAFVRTWLGLPNFRGRSQFRTWLYRIVTNLCYNRLPSLRRELTSLGDDCLDNLVCNEVLNINPADSLEAREQLAALHHAIEQLPDSYHLLVTLRYQQELSYEEIAAVVNLPLGTVKTGLFRAKERLRQTLLKDMPAIKEHKVKNENSSRTFVSVMAINTGMEEMP